MKKQIHIIYLPGFGGKYDKLRLWILRRWRFAGVSVEMVPMNWPKGTLDQKMASIDRAIDRAGDKYVVLVGESAGGTMVARMMARRDDIDASITVCGKNSHPETVGDYYLSRSSAFRSLVERMDRTFGELSPQQRAKITSIVPLYDQLIPVSEMLPQGYVKSRVVSVGHLVTIAMMLTLYSPILIRIARRTVK